MSVKTLVGKPPTSMTAVKHGNVHGNVDAAKAVNHLTVIGTLPRTL